MAAARLTAAVGICMLTTWAFGLEPHAPLHGPYLLDHVVDGDTIRVMLAGESTSVRLIGIDTPETKAPGQAVQPFGPEAAAALGRLVAGGVVWLELDVQLWDRYDRLLAYVYVRDPAGAWTWEGGRFTQLNLALAARGWADLLTIPPDVRYADLYRPAVRDARQAGRGMWGRTPPARGAATGPATATAAATAAVRIACVLYNPVGRDVGAETVTLEVRGSIDTRGWRIRDEAGHVLAVPPGRFTPGDVVTVANRSDPIWNNGGDTVTLVDPEGRVADVLSYPGGGHRSCR